VELIHAYSLVHDDLPAMDDDDLRRGRPTCHRAFDEATAILAGDALLTLAFELLAGENLRAVLPDRRLGMIRQLSMGAGATGMVGGQSLDVDATGAASDHDMLLRIHGMKTGALIRASCVLGGLAVNESSGEQLDALGAYGKALGMTFQIVDDILDATADSETLGKSAGADNRMRKSTFVTLLGLDAARDERDNWQQKALESAALLGDNEDLFHQLANFAVARSY
jgi:geranylgeranyl pyrophosphate synthase